MDKVTETLLYLVGANRKIRSGNFLNAILCKYLPASLLEGLEMRRFQHEALSSFHQQLPMVPVRPARLTSSAQESDIPIIAIPEAWSTRP